jgi:hypothetical protein
MTSGVLIVDLATSTERSLWRTNCQLHRETAMAKPSNLAVLASTFLGASLWIWSGSEALAQDTCKRKIDNSGAKSSYTEQHVLDVGDRPGHQVRIFELHRQFTSDTPNCEGRTRKESWSHGYSDYVNGNGRAWGYAVTTFDNGDKVFSDFSGTSHTNVMADGTKKRTYVGVNTFTRGTGIYRGIRGVERQKIIFDPIANINIAESEEEYSIEK